MCLCWDYDNKGNVIGMVGPEELARRIHDPNYMPELKARKRTMIELEDHKIRNKITPDRKLQLERELIDIVSKWNK
jgi:hypothetical protein